MRHTRSASFAAHLLSCSVSTEQTVPILSNSPAAQPACAAPAGGRRRRACAGCWCRCTAWRCGCWPGRSASCRSLQRSRQTRHRTLQPQLPRLMCQLWRLPRQHCQLQGMPCRRLPRLQTLLQRLRSQLPLAWRRPTPAPPAALPPVPTAAACCSARGAALCATAAQHARGPTGLPTGARASRCSADPCPLSHPRLACCSAAFRRPCSSSHRPVPPPHAPASSALVRSADGALASVPPPFTLQLFCCCCCCCCCCCTPAPLPALPSSADFHAVQSLPGVPLAPPPPPPPLLALTQPSAAAGPLPNMHAAPPLWLGCTLDPPTFPSRFHLP